MACSGRRSAVGAVESDIDRVALVFAPTSTIQAEAAETGDAALQPLAKITPEQANTEQAGTEKPETEAPATDEADG